MAVAPECKPVFRKYLQHSAIGSGEHYPTLVPEQNAMAGVPHEVIGDCAMARRIAGGEVSLPIHPYMTDEEVERVIDACNGWQR